MIKRFIILLFIVILVTEAKAQNCKHTIGIQAGAFTRKYSGPENSLEFSPAAGIFYRYQFSKRFGVNAGILYRKVFAKEIYNYFSIGNTPVFAPYKLQHNYLNAPIHLVVNLNRKEEAAWKFNFLIGGSFQKYLRSTIIEQGDYETGQDWIKYYFPQFFAYADAAFEVEHILNQKYSLSFSPGYRYQMFDDYRDKGFYGLVKLGRNF